MLEIVTLVSTLLLIAVLLYMQRKILKELKNIRIPPPQKVEFPKIEIPPAKEVVLDLNPVVEAVKNISISPPSSSITAELLQNVMNTQNDLIKSLQEIATLIRVNEAEFQSGLETFHKAIDKLLTQIPTEEKELNTQKEFMQKFEEAFVKVQETAAETMNENSLRLQEILTEFLNREAK